MLTDFGCCGCRKKRRPLTPALTRGLAEQGPAFSVSMRHAFVPFSGSFGDKSPNKDYICLLATASGIAFVSTKP